MKQTKWQELTKWLSKRSKFTWSQVNKAFGHRPSDLNSYTTYLNTLRRAGYVQQTGRGQYKVMGRKAIATVTRLEAVLYLELARAEELTGIESRRAERYVQTITKMCEEKTESDEARAMLRQRILDLESEVRVYRARAQELSAQVIRMDARATGPKVRRIAAVIRRELNR